MKVGKVMEGLKKNAQRKMEIVKGKVYDKMEKLKSMTKNAAPKIQPSWRPQFPPPPPPKFPKDDLTNGSNRQKVKFMSTNNSYLLKNVLVILYGFRITCKYLFNFDFMMELPYTDPPD